MAVKFSYISNGLCSISLAIPELEIQSSKVELSNGLCSISLYSYPRIADKNLTTNPHPLRSPLTGGLAPQRLFLAGCSLITSVGGLLDGQRDTTSPIRSWSSRQRSIYRHRVIFLAFSVAIFSVPILRESTTSKRAESVVSLVPVVLATANMTVMTGAFSRTLTWHLSPPTSTITLSCVRV